jgi:hypothetical protein
MTAVSYRGTFREERGGKSCVKQRLLIENHVSAHYTVSLRVLGEHAQLILQELGEYLGYSPPPPLERVIEDAQQIHKQRPILQETLATATQPRCES